MNREKNPGKTPKSIFSHHVKPGKIYQVESISGLLMHFGDSELLAEESWRAFQSAARNWGLCHFLVYNLPINYDQVQFLLNTLSERHDSFVYLYDYESNLADEILTHCADVPELTFADCKFKNHQLIHIFTKDSNSASFKWENGSQPLLPVYRGLQAASLNFLGSVYIDQFEQIDSHITYLLVEEALKRKGGGMTAMFKHFSLNIAIAGLMLRESRHGMVPPDSLTESKPIGRIYRSIKRELLGQGIMVSLKSLSLSLSVSGSTVNIFRCAGGRNQRCCISHRPTPSRLYFKQGKKN